MYAQGFRAKVSTAITLLVAVVQDLLLRSTKRCISCQYVNIAIITKNTISNILILKLIILLIDFNRRYISINSITNIKRCYYECNEKS